MADEVSLEEATALARAEIERCRGQNWVTLLEIPVVQALLDGLAAKEEGAVGIKTDQPAQAEAPAGGAAEDWGALQ